MTNGDCVALTADDADGAPLGFVAAVNGAIAVVQCTNGDRRETHPVSALRRCVGTPSERKRKQRHRAKLVDIAGKMVTIGCRVKVRWPMEKESFFRVLFGKVERVLPDHPQWDGGAYEVLYDDEELCLHPTSDAAGVLKVVDDDCCAMPQLGISIRTVCMDDPIKLQLNEPFGCPKTSRVLFTANGNKTCRDNTLRLRGKFSSSLAADLDAAVAARKNHVKVRIVAATPLDYWGHVLGLPGQLEWADVRSPCHPAIGESFSCGRSEGGSSRTIGHAGWTPAHIFMTHPSKIIMTHQ